MKTLVLGLGNPILTDDGVGIHIVRAAERRARALPGWEDEGRAVTFAEASVGGLRLLEVLVGYERAILVDAIQTPGGRPGQIHRLGLPALSSRGGDLRASLHSGSTHDLTLPGALALGRELGLCLPGDADIAIVAVEAEDVLTFGETCTPAVEASIPGAVDQLLQMADGRQRVESSALRDTPSANRRGDHD